MLQQFPERGRLHVILHESGSNLALQCDVALTQIEYRVPVSGSIEGDFRAVGSGGPITNVRLGKQDHLRSRD